jgi:hypothetical protein
LNHSQNARERGRERNRETERERERKRPWSPNTLRRHFPKDLKPPTRLHLLKFPLPPNSAKLGTKPLTHGPLGYLSDPNYSRKEEVKHGNYISHLRNIR